MHSLRIARSKIDKEQGFTLIELLVVIMIIGVLAAIALPIFMNQQKAAIQASVVSDLKSNVSSTYAYIALNPKTTLLDIHSDDTNPNPNRPAIVKTGNNIVSISGTPASFRIITKDESRAWGCSYYSDTGKTNCTVQ